MENQNNANRAQPRVDSLLENDLRVRVLYDTGSDVNGVSADVLWKKHTQLCITNSMNRLQCEK